MLLEFAKNEKNNGFRRSGRGSLDQNDESCNEDLKPTRRSMNAQADSGLKRPVSGITVSAFGSRSEDLNLGKNGESHRYLVLVAAIVRRD
jgi:hypothetical protein